MRLPRKIDLALKRRTKLAYELMDACSTVDGFLLENNIDPDEAAWLTGCMVYAEPSVAERIVRQAIDEK